MITTAIVLFVFAALLGLALAVPIIKKRSPNRLAIAAHGAVAATALVLLIIYMAKSPSGLLQTSVAAFVVAAIGGATLAYRDVKLKKPGPVALVLVHALVAATGLALVLLAVLA